jgi:hypothetical protein
MGKAVRLGVLGLRRGGALARLAQQAGMQVVAVCERDDQRRQAAKALGAAAYRDVEPFLDHDMGRGRPGQRLRPARPGGRGRPGAGPERGVGDGRLPHGSRGRGAGRGELIEGGFDGGGSDGSALVGDGPLINSLREYWASEVVELSPTALAHQQRNPNGG